MEKIPLSLALINLLTIRILIIIYIFISHTPHPMIILILILRCASIICILLSIWRYNFIYSIILFLIIIRGILIIFLYFSRLISNEQNKQPNIYTLIIMPLNIIIITLLINKITPKSNNYIFYHSIENSPMTTLNNKIFNNITKIYFYPFNNLTFISILYLLISLLTIIKICSIKSISLRKIM